MWPTVGRGKCIGRSIEGATQASSFSLCHSCSFPATVSPSQHLWNIETFIPNITQLSKLQLPQIYYHRQHVTVIHCSTMKPLTDLPSGHPNRNASSEQPGHTMGKIGVPHHTPKSELTPLSISNKSSVQNMLRNDTELGLSTQFTPKHAYKPPSLLHPGSSGRLFSNRGPSGFYTDPRSLNDQENVDLRQGVNYDTLKLASNAANPGRMAYYNQHSRETVEEYRSWSMTQRSYANHALERHPHQTVTYHSRGIGPNGRPRSPYAYPTRLKRPGYRPSSPAWSDINQTGYSLSPNLRPGSPASTHSVSHVPAPWQQHG